MSIPFIVIEGQEISLAKACQYLQETGKLDGFIGEVLRQHIVEQAIATREDLAVPPEMVQQAVTEFRIQGQLTAPEQFQEWLASQNIDDEGFRQRVTLDLKFNQLRDVVTTPRLQEYFIERKLFLDRVVLSRIAVLEKDLAEELRQQIEEGARFEELAQEYSVADERIFNGMMGLISRGELPDNLRAALDTAEAGSIVGPVEVQDAWTLFRVEKVMPATLDDPKIVQALQTEILEQWVLDQLQGKNIEVKLGDDV